MLTEILKQSAEGRTSQESIQPPSVLVLGTQSEWSGDLIKMAEFMGFSASIVSSSSVALSLIADLDPAVLVIESCDSDLGLEDICNALRIPRQIRPLALLLKAEAAAGIPLAEEWEIDDILRSSLTFDRLAMILMHQARVTWLQRRLIDRENEILDSLPHAMIEVDAKTVIWRANAMFAELIGNREPDFRWQVLGRNLRSAFHSPENSGKSFVSGFQSALRNAKRKYRGQQIIGETELILSANITALKQNSDHFLVELRDVTEEEAALRAEARRERLATIGNLAVGAAHEIQNPNTFSRVNVENLRQLFSVLKPAIASTLQESDAKIGTLPLSKVYTRIEDAMSGIETASRRIEAVLSTLNTFGRKPDSDVSTADLHLAIDEAVLLTKHDFNGKIKLQLELPDTLPEVVGSNAELSQVFVNLLTNSVKAFELPGKRSSDPPLVKIHLDRTTRQEIVVAVSDNGPGIGEEIQKKIFRPYYTTRKQGEGTGLGLSISSDILHHFDGSLSVRSSPGSGASFLVTLKRVETNQKQVNSGA